MAMLITIESNSALKFKGPSEAYYTAVWGHLLPGSFPLLQI